MTRLLEGKIALITGTAGGQGRAAALAFSRDGATIVGCDLNMEGNTETARIVERAGGTMTPTAPVDLTDPDQVRAWVDKSAEDHGGIDVLYNNAADTRVAPIVDMSVEDWRHTLRSEVDTVFFGTKFAWPHLVARGGGVIINTASVAGMLGAQSTPYIGAHAAGKGAVIAFTRQAAVEGAPVGIRVVAISPGPIQAPGAAQFETDRGLWDAIGARTLLNRWGTAEEIANVAVFLASDRAAYITGANYPVDGGHTSF